MKIEDQVCSLQQSRKLKELGVVQEGQFFWGNDLTKSKPKMILHSKSDVLMNMAIIDKYIIPKVNIKHWLKEKKFLVAFSVAELGVMLPEHYPSWRFTFKKRLKWITTVILKDNVKDGKTIKTANEFDRYEETEAQSRATLLIALLENEVIKVADVNKRLIKK